ncbi:MAG: hypothetical protein ACLRJV_08695 [Eubacteriales bacterium]
MALFVILLTRNHLYPIASLIVSQQYELLAEAADAGRAAGTAEFHRMSPGNFTPSAI